jgi:hypothetical protein
MGSIAEGAIIAGAAGAEVVLSSGELQGCGMGHGDGMAMRIKLCMTQLRNCKNPPKGGELTFR